MVRRYPPPQFSPRFSMALAASGKTGRALRVWALGDCWPHPAFAGETPANGYVPLHKLSQWLTYSLFEPLNAAGVAVCGSEELTGLAEYRNGGLFVDMNVMVPRNSGAQSQTYTVSDPFVVGWRALTVALLDRLAPLVRERLEVDAASFPLAKVLEGGTWVAGRLIARDRRVDGGPPFKISSDGTVFLMDSVTTVDHPLVQHKLTLMRDKRTSTSVFRQLTPRDRNPFVL